MKTSLITETKVTGVNIHLTLREFELLKTLLGTTSLVEKVMSINKSKGDNDYTNIREITEVDFFRTLAETKIHSS